MAECGDKSLDCLSSLMQEKLNLDHEDIKKKLNELECPFSWELPFQEYDPVDMLRRTELKLDDMKNEDEELAVWKAFVLNMVLCHQYTVKGGVCLPSVTAFNKLTECESALREGKSTPQFFHIEGMNHILQASRAFLLFYSKKFKEAEDLLENITHPENMHKKCLATVCGARAGVLMEYGYEGAKKSISYAERAINLEPDCAEWHFLLGRGLGRLRRVDSRLSIPDKKELQALEKACELTPCKAFMALLAQSYRETARSVFFNTKCERKSFQPYCETLNRKSRDLYRKLMEEAEENVHLNVRCAQGFLKLPKPYKDLVLAKKCIERALAVSPENTFVNHVAGTYYSMMDDMERAVKHFRVSAEAGNYGAGMDLVYTQFTNQRNYDPVPDLEKLYERFKIVTSYSEDTLCNLGSYFYFKRSDFRRALGYWSKVIDSNIHSEKLQVFRSRFVKNGHAKNINKIVVNEILTQMSDGNLSKEEEELYNKLLAQYSEHHPGLVKVLSRQKSITLKVPQNSSNPFHCKNDFSKNETNRKNVHKMSKTKSANSSQQKKHIKKSSKETEK